MKSFNDFFSKPILSPHLSTSVQEKIFKAISAAKVQHAKLADHLWVMSSGTESQRLGKIKMVALSRQAVLAAAEGVVSTFNITSKDVYLNPLPLFHIGGIAVWARQEISGCRAITASAPYKWNAAAFCDLLNQESVTITSLVPTQIYDLVTAQLSPPKSLRVVFVGAGELAENLLLKAEALGWPLVLTYGMTETCAMLAYRKTTHDGYIRFPHIKDWKTIEVMEQDRLAFLSPALLSGFLLIEQNGEWTFIDPKQEGWYVSDDVGEILGDKLFLSGRSSELVKILGETVSIAEIQSLWEKHMAPMNSNSQSVVVALPDERLGFQLALVSTNPEVESLMEEFNQEVLPFQRLKQFYCLPQIPMSPMGKVLRHQLVYQILNA